MSENNNTALVYKSQPIDLNVLSVLDVTKAGKVVSAETWKNLWDLVLNRINEFDTYCVKVCNSINAWNDLSVALKEASLQFYYTTAKLEAQFNALKTGLVHYGESEPENQNIVLWAQPVAAGSDGSVDTMVIARTDAVLGGIVDKYLTDLNIPSIITSKVKNEVNALKLVGKKTASGGEVFNNYTNNKAMSPNSSASGDNTVAGTKGFSIENLRADGVRIKNYKQYASQCETDSQRICVNDKCIIVTNNGVCIRKGIVTAVNLTQDLITIGELEAGLAAPNTSDTSFYFIAIDKPLCGNLSCGSAAQASGLYTRALVNNARSVGYYTKALAMNANAEGSFTEALGVNSHSEGYKTRATKMTAHAEGWTTQATGNNSHSEGVLTEAVGSQAHTEGWETKATGTNAHAEGKGTIAQGNEQHVSGRYNDPNKTALLIVGNGTSDANRKNAFSVNENGTATVQSDPVGNMDVATKQYVEQFINSQLAGYSSVIHSLEEQITDLNTKIGLLTQRVEQLEGGV